ncbi:uncharacterized protein LOC135217893 isoform X3 [Macrobrachium nipponense]|uniref:uncharacterized protein LOC135217893 isoform X3 n=1 Tax=Macrobrachium nipponense TaxID=159736 RepID=UPI0030C7FC5A
MQAAGLLKDRKDHGHAQKTFKAKPVQPMAKPVLMASITQDNCDMATVIEEAGDGMHFITSHVKLPNGKSAWGKSVAEKQKASESHKRWVNKNKVQGDDVVPYSHDGDEDDDDDDDDDEGEFVEDIYAVSHSYSDYDSDGEEEEPIADAGADAPLGKNPDGRYRQTGVVNIVLYVGFGLVTLGLIITFVGIGEHGFKSPELQLIGPSLIGCGVLFCLLRLFFCSVPACCNLCRRNKQLDEKALLSPSRETLADDSAEDQTIPQPLVPEEDKEPEENEENAAAKSAQTIRSTIPNYIDDGDDDHSLGLHVEYIDEGSKQSMGGSRPASSQSKMSLASKASKLADVHSTASRSNSELVLNPATLQSPGD